MCGLSPITIEINKIFKTTFVGLNNAYRENLTHLSGCNMGLADTNYSKLIIGVGLVDVNV